MRRKVSKVPALLVIKRERTRCERNINFKFIGDLSPHSLENVKMPQNTHTHAPAISHIQMKSASFTEAIYFCRHSYEKKTYQNMIRVVRATTYKRSEHTHTDRRMEYVDAELVSLSLYGCDQKSSIHHIYSKYIEGSIVSRPHVRFSHCCVCEQFY